MAVDVTGRRKVLALGEIMCRLSVGGGVRLADAASFDAHYGGAEANVAISLANFGHDAAFATKVPENPLGDAVVRHLRRNGVDASQVLRGGARLGTYYLEIGAANRGSVAVYDRAGSSFATMASCEWDVDELLSDVGLFHVTGICPALSASWRALTLELVRAAAERGIPVSYDVNFRGKLWTWDECMDAFRDVLPHVTYLAASWGDVQSALGLERTPWSEGAMVAAYDALVAAHPGVRAIYCTRRVAHSSSSNDLTGYLYTADGTGTAGSLTRSRTWHVEPIVDRVGGGDAFAGGVLHGLLAEMAPADAIEFAAAASVLKHSVAGDANRFTAAEVTDFMASGADVKR